LLNYDVDDDGADDYEDDAQFSSLDLK
jgi:hypothetical protein